MQPYNNNKELTFAACRIDLEGMRAKTTNMQFYYVTMMQQHFCTQFPVTFWLKLSMYIYIYIYIESHFQFNKLHVLVCINKNDGYLVLK